MALPRSIGASRAKSSIRTKVRGKLRNLPGAGVVLRMLTGGNLAGRFGELAVHERGPVAVRASPETYVFLICF